MTPDDTKIVSGSDNGPIKVWDLVSGQLLNTFEGHTGEVRSLAVAPDNIRVASGGGDKTLMVWDINSGQLIHDTSDLDVKRYFIKSIVSVDNNRVITDLPAFD